MNNIILKRRLTLYVSRGSIKPQNAERPALNLQVQSLLTDSLTVLLQLRLNTDTPCATCPINRHVDLLLLGRFCKL